MYRDDRTDLAEFTKHVQIAETLFVVHVEQHEQLIHGWQAELRHACALSWLQLWEQLEEACVIVMKRGRDVSRVLAARRRANPEAVDLYVSGANREAALLAFLEIRRCMPEVVVPTEIPAARRNAVLPEPPRMRVLAAVTAIVIAAIWWCTRL